MERTPPGGPLRRVTRRAAGGLMVLGAAALVLAVLWALAIQRLSDPTAEDLPPSLAGQALSSAGYGAEAVAQVSRLHGREFPLTSGAVGHYGPQAEITVWATGTLTQIMARSMLRRMEQSIAQRNSPFTPLGMSNIGGRTVHALSGMGQDHYYFQSGSTVVWIAASPQLSAAALREALAFYP